MNVTHPNRHLFGKPGSLWQLETPALTLDLDALEANIARAALLARTHRIALRPHAKTHKSAKIARMQVDAGALGVCVQTVGEAEALAAAGVQAIHVAAVTVSPHKAMRLASLTTNGRDIMCVVDTIASIDMLVAAAKSRGGSLGVLVQIDTGRGREGVAKPADAVTLAKYIASSRGLRFRGIQAYAGWVQHIVDVREREAAAAKVRSHITEIRDALVSASLAPEIVTGAGTGSLAIDAGAGVFTELQPGSYVFMDADYGQLAHASDDPPYATSLHVMVSVVSALADGHVTTDGGIKSFAMDKGPPLIERGVPPGSTYLVNADEHGRITLPPGTPKPPAGTRVLCVTPHCDPTVNLYDWYHVYRGDTLVDLWPVDARGKSL